MQVVFHLGAHCTDEDRLLKCLLKNKGPLAEEGIVVPGPGRYRAVLREAMVSLRGRPAPPEMQQSVLDAVMDQHSAKRLIFSSQAFLSAGDKTLVEGQLYDRADERSHWLRQIFPDHECAFFLALRNPATFLPALFQRVQGDSFDAFLSDADPRQLSWTEVVTKIRDANPDAALTVWCNEDTPLIWPEILQAISGHSPALELEGADDFLASIMTPAGMARLRSYLASHPPSGPVQRRRIVAAFLDKFAIEEEVEMELDIPGWTEDLVEEITENYEEDVFAIERMDGVSFLAP